MLLSIGWVVYSCRYAPVSATSKKTLGSKMKSISPALACLMGLSLAACQPGQDASTEEAAPQTAAVLAATPLGPQPSMEPQNTTQASLLSESNWVVLFAGHDLSSFRAMQYAPIISGEDTNHPTNFVSGEPNEVGDAQWDIIDDYVEAEDDLQAFLVTKGHYTDFLLQLEFWNGPGSNSGIFIRNENADVINADLGYEVNIYDTNPNPDNRTGAIVFHAPPITAVSTEEQWNTYEITAQGNQILVRVNGTVTVDYENDEHPSGPIAFQNNGGLIRFRNIRIRPL